MKTNDKCSGSGNGRRTAGKPRAAAALDRIGKGKETNVRTSRLDDGGDLRFRGLRPYGGPARRSPR